VRITGCSTSACAELLRRMSIARCVGNQSDRGPKDSARCAYVLLMAVEVRKMRILVQHPRVPTKVATRLSGPVAKSGRCHNPARKQRFVRTCERNLRPIFRMWCRRRRRTKWLLSCRPASVGLRWKPCRVRAKKVRVCEATHIAFSRLLS
jgi:hypothetical protein